MTQIKPEDLALGTVFPYSDAFDQSELANWLEEQGFSLTDLGSQEGQLNQGPVQFGPEGIQLGTPPFFAEDGQFKVLVNANADLNGFDDSSFVTFKDLTGESFESIKAYAQTFWDEYPEFNVGSEARLAELTYSGKIAVDSNEHQFNRFFDSSRTDALQGFGGGDGLGNAARFSADLDTKDDGWFRLVLDSNESPNPRRWGYQLTFRRDSYGGFSKEAIDETLVNLVDSTKEA